MNSIMRKTVMVHHASLDETECGNYNWKQDDRRFGNNVQQGIELFAVACCPINELHLVM